MKELVPRAEVDKLRGKKKAIVELLLSAYPGGYTNVSVQAVGGFNYTARISDLRKEWLPAHGLEIKCVDPKVKTRRGVTFYRIQPIGDVQPNLFPVEGRVQADAFRGEKQAIGEDFVPERELLQDNV